VSSATATVAAFATATALLLGSTYILLACHRKMNSDASASGSAACAASASAAPEPATPAEIMRAILDEETALTDSPHVPAGIELKMVICVRTDLEMSKGKVAAQVGHAVLGAYRVAQRLALPREWARAWLFRAQAKITLKAESEAALDAIAAAATAAGIPWCIIEDAGRTEVEPGTRTVIGVGPAPKHVIDAITGPKGSISLRLLN
jgi:PTH2 family peptidyl-tRNA hydrolase